LAILCFISGTTRERTSWWGLITSYAAMGMAVLAKGPIGVLLPSATIGLFTLASLSANDSSRLPPAQGGLLAGVWRLFARAARMFHPRHAWAAIRRLHPLMGLVIVFAVAGPWYVLVGLRTDGAWLAGFFGKHNLGRFLQPLEHHRGPFFYYLVAIFIGFFPWSLFLGPGAIYVRSQFAGDRATHDRWRLLIAWVVAYVGFFSLAATKLPSYIVPAYPALALIVGASIDAWLKGEYRVPLLLLRTAWTSLLLVGVAFIVALPIIAVRLFGGDPLLGLTGLPLLLGGAVCWWCHLREQPRRVAATFAVTAVVFSLAVFAGGAVEVDRFQTSARFAQVVRQQTFAQPAIVRTLGYWRPSLVFYLRQPVAQFFADDDIRAFCQAWPVHGFLLITGDHYPKVREWLPSDVCVLERKRWFLRSQDILLLGRADAPITTTEPLAWHTSPSH
jgi:4-amino-4-deoxy-L-arabinose transferase-like glycosyltransferase